MKISPVLIAYTAAGAAGLYVAYRLATAATRGAQAVAETAATVVKRDLNPASTENIVNRGVSAVGEAVTGEQGWSLGGWLAKVTGADKDAEIAAMLKGSDVRAAQARYERPPVTGASAPRDFDPPAMSFLGGASFKDLASADQINAFSYSDPFGGGLTFK